jgi:flagellar hook-length control protein FliK
MWIASVPVAAPVVPGAAPAAPPAEGDAAFGDALDASLLEGQAPAAPAASSRPVFDQRAVAAFLLTGTPVATTPDTSSGLDAAPSETGATADEDGDDADLTSGSAAGLVVDPLLVAPVAAVPQPVEGSTVEVPDGAAERPADGDGRLMTAVTIAQGASAQDATIAQDASAAESATTEQAEAAPAHAAKAAEPQQGLRLKPEAAVKKDEAAVKGEAVVTAATSQGTESSDEVKSGPAGGAGQPSAGRDVTKPVAMKAGAAAADAAAHATAQAVAAAEASATESAAPAAETAIATSVPGQRGERETRDATIGMARVPVSPAAAQFQAQMGGGDAQSFDQDGRRSPAAQRLAAALSMTAPNGAHESANGSAPVFSLPGHPTAAAAPIAPAAAAPTAPAQVDAENVETLVQAMRVTAKAGGWEATVRLRPEHLGEVTIALRVEGKNVSAVVQAESAGVRQWLMSQEDAVRSGMSEHGLQLDRFAVSRDGQRREAEEQQPQQQQQRRRAPQRAIAGNEPRFEVVA